MIRSGPSTISRPASRCSGTLEERRGREGARGRSSTSSSAGKLAPAVQLDLVDAMQASGSPALAGRLDAYQKSQGGAERWRWRSARRSLQGGNVGRGRERFVEHPAAQCTRCHTVRNAGSDVGPNLTGVAHAADARPDPRVAARSERAHRPRLRHGCHHAQERPERRRHAAGRDGDGGRRHDRDAAGRAADRQGRHRRADQPGLRDAAGRAHRQAARGAGSRRVSRDAEVAQGSGLRQNLGAHTRTILLEP